MHNPHSQIAVKTCTIIENITHIQAAVIRPPHTDALLEGEGETDNVLVGCI